MSNINQINCTKATYIDKNHPTSNFSKSPSLVAGIINNRSIGLNIYKMILNFKISDITPEIIKSAYLFIFVKNIKFFSADFNVIGICGNYENVNIDSVNWNTFPKECFTELINIGLPKNSDGSYIKVNITSIIKDLSKYDINYNVIFSPISVNSNIIVKFASCYSDNPPYIKLEMNEEVKKKTSSNDKKVKIDSLQDSMDDSNTNETQHKSQDTTNTSYRNIKSDNIISHEENIKTNDLIKVKDIPKINFKPSPRDSFKDNETLPNISELFTEISNALNYQSEFLSRLKNSNNTAHYDNMFSSITYKIENLYEEFSAIQQELTLKSSTKDIDLTNTIISKISQKIDLQNSALNSIQHLVSNNCSTQDLDETNNIINTLVHNLESLTSIIDEIKELSISTSTSEEIKDLMLSVQKSNELYLDALSSYRCDLMDEIKNNSNTLSNVSTSNETYYKSISSSLEKLDERLSNFENTSVILSQNFQNLNQEISKLKGIISPIYDNLNLLKSDINTLKDTVINLNSEDSYDNAAKINHINERLNFLAENIEKIRDIISSITIEPLN